MIDNRVMLRDIHYFLKDQKNYEIKYVLFSPRAFSTFVEYRPDIILVDAEAFVYYKKIIELFAQSLWDYRVILIVSHHDLEKQFRNVTLISLCQDVQQKNIQIMSIYNLNVFNIKVRFSLVTNYLSFHDFPNNSFPLIDNFNTFVAFNIF